MNLKINKQVKFDHLGRIDYQAAWDYQTKLFDQIIQTKIANRKQNGEAPQATNNYLLFVEHPHVYTLGKSGVKSNLLIDENALKKRGASFYHINRGGDITYHGPGQIVGYPILDLDNFFTDIHRYLRYLEEAVILTLKEYGLDAGRIPGLTGVWMDHKQQKDPRKICALGVKASRWVTMHGFAFNVNTDLTYFDYIVPCGIENKAVTSLATELGKSVEMEAVEEKLKRHLAEIFEMELV